MPDRPAQFGQHKPAQRVGGSAAVRDHSRAYRNLCARILANEPLCRYCRASGRITAARVVDHIVALSLGGSNDAANLCPACRPCNDAKAIAERRFAARGFALADVTLDHDLGTWIRRALVKQG